MYYVRDERCKQDLRAQSKHASFQTDPINSIRALKEGV